MTFIILTCGFSMLVLLRPAIKLYWLLSSAALGNIEIIMEVLLFFWCDISYSLMIWTILQSRNKSHLIIICNFLLNFSLQLCLIFHFILYQFILSLFFCCYNMLSFRISVMLNSQNVCFSSFQIFWSVRRGMSFSLNTEKNWLVMFPKIVIWGS